MKPLFDLIRRSLSSRDVSRGIGSFRDWRFYLVAALLLASTLCFARDPYFIVCGEFVYRQGVVVLLLALVIAAAFAWETPIFGKPAGANLLLQVMAMVPFALLVVRLCATDGGSSSALMEPRGFGFWQTLYYAYRKLVEKVIPFTIRDLFGNWHVTFLFLLTLLALCFRSILIRVGFIVILLSAMFFSQLNRQDSMGWMLIGILLLIAALAFMFCRYDQTSYFENVLRRIRRSNGIGEEEMLTILWVMDILYSKKRISQNAFHDVVKSRYSPLRHYDAAELSAISAELARRMVNNYGLASVRNDGDGIFLVPDRALFFCGDNVMLSAVSVWPRIVFVCGFALLWVMMPLDLVPDGLPVVGVLDDLAVTILCGVIVYQSFPSLKRYVD